MLRKRIQLGLIHAAVAITLVPINSTLNRIMIEDLGIYAILVVLLFSPPYLFSFVQVAIGSFSDRHPILGLRRSPYIAVGLILCVIGLMLAAQVALLLPNNFWMGSSRKASSSHAKLIEVPRFPARPVRPILCT